MIDGSEKRNRQLAFELQNSHVCEKRSNKQTNKRKQVKCNMRRGKLQTELRLIFHYIN